MLRVSLSLSRHKGGYGLAVEVTMEVRIGAVEDPAEAEGSISLEDGCGLTSEP